MMKAHKGYILFRAEFRFLNRFFFYVQEYIISFEIHTCERVHSLFHELFARRRQHAFEKKSKRGAKERKRKTKAFYEFSRYRMVNDPLM